MQNIVLANGVEMPILGFGVFQVDNKECQRVVSDAISIGYRLIDTAAIYGNEEAVGNAIKSSGIKREEFFITTKLWVGDSGYEKAKKSFEIGLKKLQLDYLDLYLIHQPFGDYYGSWRAMEELYKEGRIKAIGVSNFYPDRLVDLILHNEITPMVNQVETHPFFQQTNNNKIMKEHNVQIQSWGPFAEGRNDMFKNNVLSTIAKKHNKSIAQVILRWLVQNNIIAIPKSTHKERIIENIDIFDFSLDSKDLENIRSLDTDKSLFFSHYDPETVKMISNHRG